MESFASRFARIGSLAVCLTLALGVEALAAKPVMPKFDAVREVIDKHFASIRGYRPGDLICQGDWQAISKGLDRLGWKPSDSTRIRDAILADKSFLVQQSRTEDGRDFMRQISQMPQGYDRLDHLARIPNGEPTVERLIAGPDGYKMLDYMTTAPGGFILGDYLSEDENGANFNKTTGKIYTADDLVRRLQQSYTNDSRPPAPRGPISVP